MSRENYDNYDQEDFGYYAADDSINSETMENKDPAINQHQNDSDRHTHTSTHYESENSHSYQSDDQQNDPSDPFFQKNAPIAQDLDNDLRGEDDDFDNDADRRTLDEEKADEDEEEDY